MTRATHGRNRPMLGVPRTQTSLGPLQLSPSDSQAGSLLGHSGLLTMNQWSRPRVRGQGSAKGGEGSCREIS